MTMRRLTLGLAFFLTLAFGATALANSGSTTRAQAEMRTALDSFGFDITAERVAFTRTGRRDVVLQSRQSKQAVADRLINAYRTGRALPNGWKIKGWAHLVQTDSYTFTIAKDNTTRYVAEVSRDGAGSRLKLWGSAHRVNARPMPLNEIPRRYVRPHVVR